LVFVFTCLGKRYYDDPPPNPASNTKRTRKDQPGVHLAVKSDRSNTLEQRKKKVETELRKAVSKQHAERETSVNHEIEQIKDGASILHSLSRFLPLFSLLETHPEVVAMIKQLREERDKKLTLLHEWRDNQIQSIEDAAYAERKECEEEYEVSLLVVLSSNFVCVLDIISLFVCFLDLFYSAFLPVFFFVSICRVLTF
jgi:flagellar biosynthesis GTPase FlhF